MLKGKVIINEQEQEGSYTWTEIDSYMTRGFQECFKDEAIPIAFTAVQLILEKYPNNADYFQTFKYVYPDGKEIAFWIINDIDHYTVLLPSEY